jgi:hypothetical protein
MLGCLQSTIALYAKIADPFRLEFGLPENGSRVSQVVRAMSPS